jgi:hypothetical protein
MVACALLSLGAGCGGSAPARRFPLREIVWRDTDTEPVTAKCRRAPSKKDANHVECAPESYDSPLAWDGADNLVFRPLVNVFAVHPPPIARET